MNSIKWKATYHMTQLGDAAEKYVSFDLFISLFCTLTESIDTDAVVLWIERRLHGCFGMQNRVTNYRKGCRPCSGGLWLCSSTAVR